MWRWKFWAVTSAISRNFSLRFLTMSFIQWGMVEDGENASGGPSSPRSARGALLQRERSEMSISQNVARKWERVRDW